MSEEAKNSKFPKWLKWLIFLVLLIIIIIVIWLLLRPKETYTSGGEQTHKVISLQCQAGEVEDAFFQSSYATESSHEVRVTMKDDKADDLSYNFYGEYPSKASAENANAVLHGQYNKYMGEKGLSEQSLNPDFATIGDDLKITLFTSRSKLAGLTAVFFFLDADEWQHLGSYRLDDLAKLYENKGFSCQTHE